MIGEGYWDADFERAPSIPVAKPRLPTAEAVLPFLHRIDANRIYSNGGPLVREFQEALRAHCGARRVVCAANATLGLALSLLAWNPPPRSLCMIPAWSFAASAHAARLAGLVPWLVDVDPVTHQLTPQIAKALLPRAPAPVGAVMPVMPFGAPTELSAWDDFRAESGLAVVVDAAAAFDTLRAAQVPAIVSLHATKAFGVGEGCFIASNDEKLADEIVTAANFGFWNSRESMRPALNGKLSEYAAALGLAGCQSWPETRGKFERVGWAYRRRLDQTSAIRLQPGFAETWISSTVIVNLPSGSVSPVMSALSRAGIGARRWWGGGLHRHAAFAAYPRTLLPVTERLAETQLGLPCWPDLPDDKADLVCRTLVSALASPN